MKKSILLIEDNDPIRENTAELLELLNYEVIAARDGKQALDRVREKTPDLILCDIIMPGMNGYELLKTLREDYRMVSVPFIFLTAASEKKDIEKGMRMGASGYLVKPFQSNELIQLIQKYLSEQVSLEL